MYSKTCLKRPLKKDLKLVFKTNYRLMHAKSITEWEHSAILSTCIKLPFVFKTLFCLFLSGRFIQVLLYEGSEQKLELAPLDRCPCMFNSLPTSVICC